MEGKQEGAASDAVTMQETMNATGSDPHPTEGKLQAPAPPRSSASPKFTLIRQVIDRAEQKKGKSGCNSPPPPSGTNKSPSATKRPPPLLPTPKPSPPHEGSNSNGVSHQESEMTSTPPTERRQDLPRVNVPALKKPLLPPRIPGGSQKPTVALTRVQSQSSGLASVDEGGDSAESSIVESVLGPQSLYKKQETAPSPPSEEQFPSKPEAVPAEPPPLLPPPQESKPTEQNGDGSNEGAAVKDSPMTPPRKLRHRSTAMSLRQKPASLLWRSSTISAESDQFEGGDNVLSETPSSPNGFHSDITSSDDFVRVTFRQSKGAEMEKERERVMTQDSTIVRLKRMEQDIQKSGLVRRTEQLPRAIEGFPTGKRDNIIHEIYQSEYTYVAGLEVLIDVFKRPLVTVLTQSEIDSIFANVDSILHFNLEILAAFHNRLKDWSSDACVGDIFVTQFDHQHKRMYAIYCNNYYSAEQIVLQKMKRKREFELSIQQSMTEPQLKTGVTLTGYLITPVQRIPRYILLLKDVIAHTPACHPDYHQLVKAKDLMSELAEYVEEQIKESQSKEKLMQLRRKVQGLEELAAADRVLIKEGKVYLKSIKKLYRCLLFNDVIVFALGDSSRSTVELNLPLETIWVTDLENLDPQTSSLDAIDLYTPSRPYTIYTCTSNEKKLWLTALKDAIFAHLQQTGKLPAADPLTKDSTCRVAVSCYPDGSVYTGEFNDGRRHGTGEMTWLNRTAYKTVYKGDWVDDERCGQGTLHYNTGEVYQGGWVADLQDGYGELRYCTNDMYKGEWRRGVKHGKAVIEFANEDMFEGTFVNGTIEGEGKLTCANGLVYDGKWEGSLRHGNGTLTFPNGNVYVGDFRRDTITGHGIMTYWNGDCYEGEWKHGLRHGHGILRTKEGCVYDGRWEMDLRSGAGKMTYSNGDSYDGIWHRDMRHGRGRQEFANGDQYHGIFAYDMINGDGEMRYKAGGKYNGSWKHGRYDGQGIRKYADGTAYNGSWESGLRHGEGEVIYSDASMYKGGWQHDQPHGHGVFMRHRDLHYEGEWVNGMRQGKGSESSSKGCYEGQWQQNMRHGQGVEKTVVGTEYRGAWNHNRKTDAGQQKLIFGLVQDQFWSSGHLETNPMGATAVELPHLPRNEM